MNIPQQKEYALITGNVSTGKLELKGLVGKIKDIDHEQRKALIDPKYRVEELTDLRDPKISSKRFWIEFEELVKVLKRQDTIQVSGTVESVNISDSGKKYFRINDI
jgi:hypothetical protein